MKRTLFALLVCFAVAFGFRYGLCRYEVERLKAAVDADFAPFQVESAIAYAQVRAIAEGKAEAGVLATESTADLSADAQLSSGMETFLGYALKAKRWLTGSPAVDPEYSVFEDNGADSAWIRAVLAAWIALLAPAIFLWLHWGGMPRKWAFFGALLYVFMPSAVARYTGQELLKGAFALPFVAAYLAVYTRGFRFRERWCIPAAALLAFLGAANWDMAQVVFGAWALAEAARRFANGEKDAWRGRLLAAGWIGIILAAVLLPYGRAHGSLASPVILVLFPWSMVLQLRDWRWRGWLWGAALLAIWWVVVHSSAFAGNYGHFRELIVAKLQFWNVKPADPALLTFNQRFLWTPELHSATWSATLHFFPLALWMCGLLAAVGVWRRRWRQEVAKLGWQWMAPAALSIGFFVIYIYMVRFHELAALFLAPWTAWSFLVWWRTLRRSWSKALLVALMLLTLVAEADISATRYRFYPENIGVQADVVRLARAGKLDGRVVLADLEWSSLAAGYAGCRVVIQPKFELEAVRREVERYVEILYLGSEEELAEFCERHQVSYFFFRRRASLEGMDPNGYRYMACAQEIPAEAVIRLLDLKPSRLRRFRQVALPEGAAQAANKLRIFRYVTGDEREIALGLAERSVEAWRDGERSEARRWLNSAYAVDPVSEEIQELWFRMNGEAPPPLELAPKTPK